jgi:hypothetical protein
MLNIIKGIKFCRHPPETKTEKLYHCVFKFRNYTHEVESWERKNDDPFIGANLSMRSAKLLHNWLSEVLQNNNEKCDECYNFEIPKVMRVSGECRCSYCGNKIEIEKMTYAG